MSDKYPVIRVRAKPAHIETFYKLGGAKWLRKQLENHQNESATVQPYCRAPKSDNAQTSEPAQGNDDSTFDTPDGVWRIHLQKNL
jgi:hypothetical protein